MKSDCPLQTDFLGIKLHINFDIEIVTKVALDLKNYNLYDNFGQYSTIIHYCILPYDKYTGKKILWMSIKKR